MIRPLAIALALAPTLAWGLSVEESARVLCKFETRDEADAADALGPDGEVGPCQIKPYTAKQHGYTGKNRQLILMLLDPFMAEMWAREIVRECQAHNRRRIYRTLMGTAFCYNAGRQALYQRDHEAYYYAKMVAVFYAQRTREKRWRNGR